MDVKEKIIEELREIIDDKSNSMYVIFSEINKKLSDQNFRAEGISEADSYDIREEIFEEIESDLDNRIFEINPQIDNEEIDKYLELLDSVDRGEYFEPSDLLTWYRDEYIKNAIMELLIRRGEILEFIGISLTADGAKPCENKRKKHEIFCCEKCIEKILDILLDSYKLEKYVKKFLGVEVSNLSINVLYYLLNDTIDENEDMGLVSREYLIKSFFKKNENLSREDFLFIFETIFNNERISAEEFCSIEIIKMIAGTIPTEFLIDEDFLDELGNIIGNFDNYVQEVSEYLMCNMHGTLSTEAEIWMYIREEYSVEFKSSIKKLINEVTKGKISRYTYDFFRMYFDDFDGKYIRDFIIYCLEKEDGNGDRGGLGYFYSIKIVDLLECLRDCKDYSLIFSDVDFVLDLFEMFETFDAKGSCVDINNEYFRIEDFEDKLPDIDAFTDIDVTAEHELSYFKYFIINLGVVIPANVLYKVIEECKGSGIINDENFNFLLDFVLSNKLRELSNRQVRWLKELDDSIEN